MTMYIVFIVVLLIIIGVIFVYEKTRSINLNLPVVGQSKIEADFDAKKKAEAERINQMSQEDLLENLNAHHRDNDD